MQPTQQMSYRPTFFSTKLWGLRTKTTPSSTTPHKFGGKKNERAGIQLLIFDASPLYQGGIIYVLMCTCKG